MKIGLGLGIGSGRRGTPQIITASVFPVTQSVVDGDTWADLLLASATDTANYASTAGTISTAVAEVNVDSGGWTALAGNTTTALTEAESVQVRVTVTDSEANERVFSAGTVVVAATAGGAHTFDSNVETFDSNILTFDEAA